MMARRLAGMAGRFGGWWVEIEWWFEPRDLWVGVFWTHKRDYWEIYVAPLPVLPVRVYWQDMR